MLSHERIWSAIDALAAAHDLTPSGLAKRAGLDSTTFNKSKRFAADGRPRWPSTESLAKIIEATGATMDDFTMLMEVEAYRGRSGVLDPRIAGHALHDDTTQTAYQAPGPSAARQSIPVVGMAQAGTGGFFDDAGYPSGEGWDRVDFPGETGRADNVYALEITGDSMLPLYRAGDRVIVSPDATVRTGDRVIVKTKAGEVLAKVLTRQTSGGIELASVNPSHPDLSLSIEEVDWMARIVWASQ